jgi:hypothetical protein
MAAPVVRALIMAPVVAVVVQVIAPAASSAVLVALGVVAS